MDANKKVAYLESLVDHLKTELSHLNDLMIQVGFPEGIATLKMTAQELLAEKEVYEESAASESD